MYYTITVKYPLNNDMSLIIRSFNAKYQKGCIRHAKITEGFNGDILIEKSSGTYKKRNKYKKK